MNETIEKNEAACEEQEEKRVLTPEEIEEAVEAIVFAAGHPVKFKTIAEALGTGEDDVKRIVTAYAEKYNSSPVNRGVEFLILGSACQLATKEEYAPYIRAALGIKEGSNLSRASLETLAIIAYNQPVTRAYIESVRGVDSTYSINVLIERELVEVKGFMDVPGRPRLYGTNENFLRIFGLDSLSALPPLEFLPQ